MKIESIHLRNFRGFEWREFHFASNFTVVIGDNASGKSSLLAGLQVGLGAFLQALPLPANPLYRRQFRAGDRFVRFDPRAKDYLPKPENPRVELRALAGLEGPDDAAPLDWQREYLPSNGTTHSQAHSGAIIRWANELVMRREHNGTGLYPVLANFYIQRSDAQVRKVDKRRRKLSRIEKGYHSALGDRVEVSGVGQWLAEYDKALRDGREFEGTREAFFEAIRLALPWVREIDFDPRLGEFDLLAGRPDGQGNFERKPASLLSDGTRSVLNMVAEIAYRCIILNGWKKELAVKLSPGVVLVDEMDLHLHPRWQRHVVRDLSNAFPKLQFIVTTHSPFVVQSLAAENLLILDKDAPPSGDPFRMSIEEIAGSEMGIDKPHRSLAFQDMQEAASRFFSLLGAAAAPEQIDEAKRQLDHLRLQFDRDPAFVALLEAELLSKEALTHEAH